MPITLTTAAAADTVSTWVTNPTAQSILDYLHYASPVCLVFFFLSVLAIHGIACAPPEATLKPAEDQTGPGGKPLPRGRGARAAAQRKSQAEDFSPARKLLFSWVSLAVILTYVADAVVVVLHTIIDREHNWWCGQPTAIYVVASVFVYGLFLVSLIDTKPSPTVVHWSSWIIALLTEGVLLAASLKIYTSKHQEPSASDPPAGRIRDAITQWEAITVCIDIIRLLLLLSLVLFYFFFTFQWGKRPSTGQTSETSSLLNGHAVESGATKGLPNGHGYGTKAISTGEQPEAWSRPLKVPSKTWWEYIRGYSLFFPYLWPAKSLRLQVTVVFCFTIIFLGRIVNVLVPIQVGRITDILAGGVGDGHTIPWGGICWYIFFRLLQGNNGLLGAVRGTLWIPISQYSYQELSTAAFEHVHGLSLDFHLGKKTGEVLSALSKGQSINTFLEQVTFQVIPMLIDLGVAIGYFLIVFDAYYALVVTIVTFVYLYLTIRLAQWRADIRREMVNFSRQEDAVKNDSMVSYETVKYFNAESYEFNRYRGAVQDFQSAEYRVLISLNIMNVSQNLVFTLGLLITCFLAAYQVTSGQRKVGDFTALLTYMAQLQGPLNFFGTFYRSIQSAMINSERMLELFKERPTVVDEPEAQDFPSCQGEIRFNDVRFAYDPRKPALKGVNFTCAPGTTTALVGESGGGKSTIFRLLFRFYNTVEGSIQIDGHDMKELKIDALRRHIGVVPQDTVLFNESLMYNLKYAKPSATDEEVYAACRAASIHDKIMTFPDGYDSRVGERGLKLSGGEKQRVAIARTIIKNPKIILLDEATAALDSDTEEHIQEALDKLSQGRTTLVIAHRLSTITTADQILVLHAGIVIESGTHAQLIAKKGRYASMWKKQIRAQKAADDAKLLSDQAKQLQSEAFRGEDSASQSEDEQKSGNSSKSSSSEHQGIMGMPSAVAGERKNGDNL